MNSPETPAFAGAEAGVCCAELEVVLEEDVEPNEVFEFVVVAELFDAALDFEFALVVAGVLFVAVFFVVATCADVFVEVAAVFPVDAFCVVEEEETVEVVAPAAPPNELPDESASSVELSCGGVIAKTAPRPPTVPPAIKSARFIRFLFPVLPLVAPRYLQTFSRLP